MDSNVAIVIYVPLDDTLQFPELKLVIVLSSLI